MTNVRRPIHLQLRLPHSTGAGSLSSLNGHHQQSQNLSNNRSSFIQQTACTPGAPKQALSPTSTESLPSQILPHLFVGGQEQTNRETVNRLNIKYILSLGLLPLVIQQGTSSNQNSTPTIHNNNSTSNNTNNNAQNNNSSATNQSNIPIQASLMPPQNCSRDFKIRIRSNTPSTTPATPTNTNGQSPCSPMVLVETLGSSPGLLNGSSNQTSASVKKQQTPNGTNNILNNCYQQAAADNNSSRDENKGVKQVRSVYCKCINVADNSDQMLMKFFDEAYYFIEEARRKRCNILVHCLAGISRSPTIAIAYLMRNKALHWKDAYEIVKQCRPQIDPNLSFMGQLRIYNKSLLSDDSKTREQPQQQQPTTAASS